jgi:signal transduction histidine kinase
MKQHTECLSQLLEKFSASFLVTSIESPFTILFSTRVFAWMQEGHHPFLTGGNLLSLQRYLSTSDFFTLCSILENPEDFAEYKTFALNWRKSTGEIIPVTLEIRLQESEYRIAVYPDSSLTLLKHQESGLSTNDSVSWRRNLQEHSNNHTKLNLALESSAIGIWSYIKDKFDWDLGSIRILGAARLPITLEDFLHKVTSPPPNIVREKVLNAFATGSLEPMEMRLRTPPEGEKWILLRGVLAPHPEQGTLQILGTITDITIHKEQEEQVRLLYRNLEKKTLELQQLSAGAAHDLKAPLRTMNQALEFIALNDHHVLSEKSSWLLQRSLLNANRMKDLIDALLRYSQLETHAKKASKVRLKKVIDVAKVHLSSLIEESGATIVLEEEQSEVIGHEMLLYQLFQNLIDNAIKYRNHSKKPEIIIQVSRKNGYTIVSIKDNGVGIPEAEHAHIFRIFKRFHTHMDVAGSGIGLALCLKIVELHHGHIEVNSKPNEGSTFMIHFPKQQKWNSNEN